MATQTIDPRHLALDEVALEAGSAEQLGIATRRRVSRWRPRRTTVIELTVFAGLAIAYNIVRSIPTSNPVVAVQHARDIVGLEGWVFHHLEVPLNEWMVAITPVAVVACYLYALLHYVATPTIFFLSRRRAFAPNSSPAARWQYWRGYWALVLASAFALIGYALYAAAPPRLTPDLGIVDVMSHFSQYGWWGSAASAPRGIGDATNQYAAMPSMHFGWALWCAIQMWGFGGQDPASGASRRRVWRTLAVGYPTVLLVVVLGTGNHFILDVAAGAACVVAAYGVVTLIGRATGRTGDRLAPASGR